MILLGTLGVAIGATTVDPGPGESPSAMTFGIGAGIWWLVSGILSLLAGGWAAARLAGLRRKLEGPLHGLITWALTVLVSTVLMTSIIGMLISGAFRVVGTTVSAAASGAGAIAGQVGVPDEAKSPDAWKQVWGEAQQILRQTETPALQPEELEEDVEAAGSQAAEADLESALSRLQKSAGKATAAADQDAVVNVLVARTDMSEAEARQRVEAWSKQLESARSAVSSGAGEVKEAVGVAAGKTMDAIAGAAWWTFIYLLLTAAAAGLGGMLGAPRARDDGDRNVREPRRTRTTATTAE